MEYKINYFQTWFRLNRIKVHECCLHTKIKNILFWWNYFLIKNGLIISQSLHDASSINLQCSWLWMCVVLTHSPCGWDQSRLSHIHIELMLLTKNTDITIKEVNSLLSDLNYPIQLPFRSKNRGCANLTQLIIWWKL